MERKKNQSNNIMKGILNLLCSLLVICLVPFINTISVSAKTTDNDYILTIQERGGVNEHINGSDIGLQYSSDKVASYDENLLKQCVNKLSCLDASKIFESQNARVQYNGSSYVIMNEVYGNKVNKDALYNNIVNAIKNENTTINLESLKCYEDPKVVANSPALVNASQVLNKYVSSKITYNFAGNVWVVDGSTIKDWMGLDSNFQVVIDEAKVRSYVDSMAYTYNSLLGSSISVSGGYDGNNHSWIIDSDQETKALIENIKSGQTIEKNPIYAQTSAASYFSNVGDTYVEIDKTKQHLWYYKNGYLVIEGDVVTGNESNGCSTPSGVYNLYFKQKDTVLTGPGYASPVCFWMPFNRNIGLHDASWRSEFGGEIYKTSGSHGCVNAPYYLAKAVYENIDRGTPVIVY